MKIEIQIKKEDIEEALKKMLPSIDISLLSESIAYRLEHTIYFSSRFVEEIITIVLNKILRENKVLIEFIKYVEDIKKKVEDKIKKIVSDEKKFDEIIEKAFTCALFERILWSDYIKRIFLRPSLSKIGEKVKDIIFNSEEFKRKVEEIKGEVLDRLSKINTSKISEEIADKIIEMLFNEAMKEFSTYKHARNIVRNVDSKITQYYDEIVSKVLPEVKKILIEKIIEEFKWKADREAKDIIRRVMDRIRKDEEFIKNVEGMLKKELMPKIEERSKKL